MKTFFLVVLVQLILFSKIASQNTTADSLINFNKIRLSDTYDYVEGTKYVFPKGRYVYTVQFANRQIEIYRFDTELNEMNKTPPDNAISAEGIEVLTIAKFGEGCIILYKKKREVKELVVTLHYRNIDLESGDIGPEITLLEMRPKDYEFYEYRFSADTAFLMVYYRTESKKQESYTTWDVNCVIYQNDFKIFEQGIAKIPISNTSESIDYVFLTNDATPYFVLNNSEKRLHRFFKLELKDQSVKENTPKEHLRWGSLYTYFNHKDQVDFVGSYDEGRYIFIQNIKNDTAANITPLPKNVFGTIIRKHHFTELLLSSALPCIEDGMLVVMQEYYKKVVREFRHRFSTFGYSGGYSNSIDEYFENRLLVRFDKDKKIKWIADIPQQRGNYSSALKYQLIDNQHYFFTIEERVDNGSLSVPPSNNLSTTKLDEYNRNKNNKIYIVKLTIVDDASGQYRLFDLFNLKYQHGRKLEHLDLKNIVVTNNMILAELKFENSSDNVMLSLPLKK